MNITDMVDAAMVEMANIHPPLRRKECERLIRAALAQQDATGAPELELFAAWKGYELPLLNNHGQFHQDWLHREFVAFKAGLSRAALQQRQAPAPLALDDELAAIEETLAKGVQRQAPAQATGCDRPLIDVETALVLQRVAQFFDAVKDEVVPAARGDDFRNMTFKDVKRCVAALADPLNAERSKVANTLDRLEDLIAAPVAQQAEAAPAPTATLNVILREVERERAAQDAQWGGPAHDDTHSNKEFAQFIYNQISRVGDGGYVGCDDRRTFIKVAALAVAAIEKIGRASGAAPVVQADAAVPTAIPQQAREDFIERIVVGVAEIDGRDSPEDQPEMMLVTVDELRAIIEGAFEVADEESSIASPAAHPANTGEVIVPRIPTAEMLEAAQALDGGDDDIMAAWAAAYSAMLDAAPAPTAEMVTRESALEAIQHMAHNNSPGRTIYAAQLLVAQQAEAPTLNTASQVHPDMARPHIPTPKE